LVLEVLRVFMAEPKRKPHAAYLTHFCHTQAERIFTPRPGGIFLPQPRLIRV
jgi:hypothetical protein